MRHGFILVEHESEPGSNIIMIRIGMGNFGNVLVVVGLGPHFSSEIMWFK